MLERILVTGGAGFIGSHLVDLLIQQGHAVTVLDNYRTGSPENLKEAAELAQKLGDKNKLKIIEGSILDQNAVETAMKDCIGVFHLAVECVRRSIANPMENHHINATGTLNVLEVAHRHKIKKFLYCSSSEVYGNGRDALLNEATTLCEPMTVYGAAKLVGEYYTKAYYRTYGMKTMVVRPFNAYGPRAHIKGDLAEVIPRFIIRLLNGLPPVIFGDGSNARDFTYVTDIARGLSLAFHCDALIGREVNIAYGKAISVKQIAEMLTKVLAKPELKAMYLGERPGDVLHLHADTRLAKTLFGYQAEIPFETGLQQYVEWFKNKYRDPKLLLEEEVINWQMPETVESR